MKTALSNHPDAVRSRRLLAKIKSDPVKWAAHKEKVRALNMAHYRKRGVIPFPVFSAAGKDHVNARVWSIRSPEGKSFRFKNLCNFVRENRALFEEGKTNAVHGIAQLRPTAKKKTPLSWKGWTWITLDERALYNSADQIERKEAHA